uniref:Calreticulin n=1 Tax=Bigelowiella natans TaxID=227086 RepID=Q5YER3_BIGNA|nr:calreticulin [Bigelowiella natans]|eukprot:jgi/Bigna1/50289/estExt_Genewise1.C_730031
MRLSTPLLLTVLPLIAGKVYLKDTFDNMDKWVKSSVEKFDGAWELSSGEWYGDAEKDQGLKTTQDAKFYALTANFDEVFDNKDKDLVIQFSVKHAQKIDCGGGYVKVFPKGFDGAALDEETKEKYSIMFGPDICGYSTKKVHVIFTYKGKQHLIKKDIKCEDDQLTHVYTLIVKPDQTYIVKIDGEEKASGSLTEDWDFLPAKEIKDPEQSKPEDWVDEEMMDDPEDKKPEGWDDIPAQIVDPEAEKPEDWDDEADGEYEAPMIDNPEYKGEWKAKRIKNPDYKGPWVHPMIANPEYAEDDSIYHYEDLGAVAFDLWQVKSGTIFDNLIITDSAEEADSFMKDTFSSDMRDAEKKMFDDAEKEKKEAEEAARKAAEKAAEEDEDDEEDDEDDEEDEEASSGHDEL